MERNSGLAYKYSESLMQNIAYDKKSGSVLCQDGATYSCDELKKIKDSQRTVPIQVHIVKKVFGGILIGLPGV